MRIFNNKKAVLPDAVVYIGVTILIFWLVFPLGLLLMGVQTSSQFTEKDRNTLSEINNINGLTDSTQLYFKYLFFTIPDVSPVLMVIKYILQFLSFFFLGMLLLDFISSIKK